MRWGCLDKDILSLCFQYASRSELATTVLVVNQHFLLVSELESSWTSTHLEVGSMTPNGAEKYYRTESFKRIKHQIRSLLDACLDLNDHKPIVIVNPVRYIRRQFGFARLSVLALEGVRTKRKPGLLKQILNHHVCPYLNLQSFYLTLFEFDPPLTPANLKAAALIPKLTRVSLQGVGFTSSLLAALHHCTQITWLKIIGEPVANGPRFLLDLSRLPRLSTFQISFGYRAGFGDEELKFLARSSAVHQSLTILDISSNTSVTSAGIDSICTYCGPFLKDLNLSHLNCSVWRSFSLIAKCTRLEKFCCGDEVGVKSGFTEADLTPLFALTRLRSLYLALPLASKVSIAVFRSFVAALPQMSKLTFGDGGLTDSQFFELRHFTRLEKLDISQPGQMSEVVWDAYTVHTLSGWFFEVESNDLSNDTSSSTRDHKSSCHIHQYGPNSSRSKSLSTRQLLFDRVEVLIRDEAACAKRKQTEDGDGDKNEIPPFILRLMKRAFTDGYHSDSLSNRRRRFIPVRSTRSESEM